MNIIFLTLVQITSITERGIYQDLLTKFREEGHNVFVITPVERRLNKKTKLYQIDGINILQVRTLNIQKSNFLEKGIGILALEYQYLNAFNVFLKEIKFDLVLYSTPPITLVKVVEYIRKRNGAKSYLLLKDIFPQNAVDLNFFKKGSFIHKFFQNKERKLYAHSDFIGCMSPANKDFILKNNPWIDADKVEVNPNSIFPIKFDSSINKKNIIREKYNLPLEKTIFVYGGNLGKPQGLDFLLEVINANNNPKVYFLIIGNGTEYLKIRQWFDEKKPNNAILLKGLPKNEYDNLLLSCDVGLIFLDKKFTIPNFPSRLLSYLEMKLPVISATDEVTDIGDVLETNNCGFKVISGDLERMNYLINNLSVNQNIKKMGENGWNLLNKEFHVDVSYKLILKRCLVIENV